MMRTLLQRFFLFLAAATDRELAHLKAENRILRERPPKHIVVTARERRTLLKSANDWEARSEKRLRSFPIARSCAGWKATGNRRSLGQPRLASPTWPTRFAPCEERLGGLLKHYS